MELIQELKKIGERNGFYSSTFFSEVNALVQEDRNKFSESIIHFLEHVEPSNFDALECQMVLAIILGNFPFVESETDHICHALGQFVLNLLKIEHTSEVISKNHLLYLVMDLFEVAFDIEGCNESTQETLFDAVKGTLNLPYDYGYTGTPDAYLKNYKIVQFYGGFKKDSHRRELLDIMLKHPDESIREEAMEET
ncbi:MAG: hypothetical protein P1U56_03075 [Saprospiraceae bacterium]|nr:hypothetical protein [Saprospiraceae bacterium]